jgi:hypothetical protein
MTSTRFITILAAALIAICGAFYLSSQRNLQRDTRGAPLFPTLGAELDSVTAVDIIKGAAAPAVSLHKSGDHWTVSQRADYPADTAKLRRLLIALGDAKVVEEKTSDPANYPIIGVEDPTKPGAAGAEISVTARDGQHSVIVGKPVGEGTFARRAGEARSYSVDPAISVEAEPHSWIDTRLIDVPTSSIESIELKPASGAGYLLHRLKPKEDDFGLDKVPAGRKALDPKALAPSVSALSGLAAEDVGSPKDLDFSQATQAIFTLADGNVLTLSGTAVGDKRWIEVHSSKNPALEQKTAGRAFEIAVYRYDAIFRTLEQLLVPKETKPPVKAGVAGNRAGAPPAQPSAPPSAPPTP